MLSLEIPALQIDGLTVYADHAVPTQFYVAAPHPTVARSGGRLMFDVFSYAVELEHSPLSGTRIPEELGAGFLTMGTECVLTTAQRSRLVRELADRAGVDDDRVSLSPIPYTKGSVSLIALDAMSGPAAGGAAGTAPPGSGPAVARSGRPTFVEQILGSGTPNLLGDLRAIFSLSLSQEGVTFLRGLYADHAAPVGVVYQLEFLGLRPAVQCRITADLRRVHEQFKAGANLQVSFLRADVDREIDELVESSAVRIELTSQAVGESAEKSKELALSLFKDRIVQELFKPTAPTTNPAALAGALGSVAGTAMGAAGTATSATTSARLGLSLKSRTTEELREVVYDFSERSPEVRTHAPQGFLPVMLSPEVLAEHQHHVSLSSPFFELLEVLVTGPTAEDFAALALRQVEARVVYGGPGDPVPAEARSVLFRPDSTGDRTIAFPRLGRPTLGYDVGLHYEFEQAERIAADRLDYELPTRPEVRRTLSVNPWVDFQVDQVEVELGHLDPSITSVDVELAYRLPDGAFAASHVLRLTPGAATDRASRTWQARTHSAQDGTFTSRATFRFSDDSAWTAPEMPVTTRLHRVDSPFAGRRRLRVDAGVTSADISRIDVEVEYDDPAAGYSRALRTVLEPDAATGRWPSADLEWPIPAAARQELRYRATIHEGGFVDTGEWLTTDEPSVVVGSASGRFRSVEVRLIGPALAEAGMDALQVTLRPEGVEDAASEVSLLFDGTSTTQSAQLVVPPGAAAGIQHRTLSFRIDGTTRQGPWVTSPSRSIVISTRTA